MVSWVPHIVIPALVALAFFRRLPRTWVMWMAPVVWVPDLDYFSPGEHRVWTHNLWIPLALLLACIVLWRRRDPTSRFLAFAARPGWPVALLLASYYWASHLLLDIFAGGVLLFWPLSNLDFFLFYEIHVNLQTGETTPIAEGGATPGAPELSTDYAWLNYEHTAVLAFLAVVGLAALALWVRRQRRAVLGRAPPVSSDPSSESPPPSTKR